MNIRRYRPGEEHRLFDVYHSAVHLVACRDYTPEQINAWAPDDLDPELWVQKIREIKPFVAELNGHLVGYADIQSDGYVDHFFVSGHHQSKGIGKLLMSALLGEAAALGLKEMTADVSRTAQPFFAKYGFCIVEQRSPEVRGVVVPNARMRKTLNDGVGICITKG